MLRDLGAEIVKAPKTTEGKNQRQCGEDESLRVRGGVTDQCH